MVESKDIHTALETQKEIFLVGDVSSQDNKGHVILKMKSQTEALKLVWDYKRLRGKFSAQFSSIYSLPLPLKLYNHVKQFVYKYKMSFQSIACSDCVLS